MSETADTKHTPGPWVWALYAQGPVLVSETDCFGSVRKPVGDGPDHPDGILRKFAPQLLDACLNSVDADCQKLAREVLRAISKANGGGA